ncbi:hypothetical protein OEZ86_008858 [Tetradesmus obliquus]|nr:hypothetical protein OEZ86_008858 [Tetradesmus obliquus]
MWAVATILLLCLLLSGADAALGTQPAGQTIVSAAASAQQYTWAKPEWGQYRRRAVVLADPSGRSEGFSIWAWDIVPESAVNITLAVLSAIVGELQDDARSRLASSNPPSKFALIQRPQQVWTDIPEQSVWKGTAIGAKDYAGVGGTAYLPVTVCDSRNVLETADDPYWFESILVHEFAHHIHAVALSGCEQAAVDGAYASALAAGSYSRGIYMMSTVYEYFACAAEGWFQGTCRDDVNDGIISRPRLLVRDPTLFSLFSFIFTADVQRFSYRSLCPNCNSNFRAEADVRLPQQAAPAPLIDLQLEKCATSANNWRPVPHNAPDCSDKQPGCRARAIAGQCDTHADMLTHCQLACGVCRQVSSSAGCIDRDASCFVAASVQGRCQSDAAGMGPQGMGCLLSCGNCDGSPSHSPDVPRPSPDPSPLLPSPSPVPSPCGTCASRHCTARQGCCLDHSDQAHLTCTCNSSRGLEPSPAGNSSAPSGGAAPSCGWALRMRSRHWQLPADAAVALPFWLAGPRAAGAAAAATPVCPPQGLAVFAGSKGSNPLGAGLVLQRRVECRASGWARLQPAVGAAALGELCAAGRSSLLFNTSLPVGGVRGDCWLVLLRLADGSRQSMTWMFY